MGPMIKFTDQYDEADVMVMSFFTEEESLQTTPLNLMHPSDSKPKHNSTLASSISSTKPKGPCPQMLRECPKFCC